MMTVVLYAGSIAIGIGAAMIFENRTLGFAVTIACCGVWWALIQLLRAKLKEEE